MATHLGRVVNLDLGVEYLVDGPSSPSPSYEQINRWLNKKAVDGWRLITVANHTYYFERPARELREDKTSPPRETITTKDGWEIN